MCNIFDNLKIVFRIKDELIKYLNLILYISLFLFL